MFRQLCVHFSIDPGNRNVVREARRQALGTLVLRENEDSRESRESTYIHTYVHVYICIYNMYVYIHAYKIIIII